MNLPDFLEIDADGDIRVARHRVRLIDVAARYDEGYSAESIVLDWYPTLSLALVHKTIAYYLENESAVREMLARNRAATERLQSSLPPAPAVDELRMRAVARGRVVAQ
jgi:uncharacterized protein (DUF433 family)